MSSMTTVPFSLTTVLTTCILMAFRTVSSFNKNIKKQRTKDSDFARLVSVYQQTSASLTVNFSNKQNAC